MRKYRLDRAISESIGYFGSGGASAVRIPILMYHGIRKEISGLRPYYETHTEPEVFETQMRWLSEQGYTSMSLESARRQLAGNANCEKHVVITFDDGYRDAYSTAIPVMVHYRMTATLFVAPGLIQSPDTPDREYMTWDEVRAAASYGMEIGSHTLTHPHLAQLSYREIEYQLRESKRVLEEETGRTVQEFSWPYAFPEHRRRTVLNVETALRACGYRGGVTTKVGSARVQSDPFFWPRLPVNTYEDRGLFSIKLSGGYDWIGKVQSMKKCLVQFVISSRDDEQARKMTPTRG